MLGEMLDMMLNKSRRYGVTLPPEYATSKSRLAKVPKTD
jgi:hypothetical protein